nr:neuropeptide CCHamide-2 receptor-like [Maniola hyperantus]
MRNAPNTYIFSLALADLLVILICVPFVSVIYTLESWPWGEAICRISETGKDISIGVSVFTLTALSAERYCAIVNPFRKLQLRKLPLVCATIIWAAALIFAAPAALFSSTITHEIDNNVSIIYCSPYPETWDSYAKWMTLTKAIIYYALPLLVIAFFYSLMAQRLLASTREMPGALHGGQGEAQAKARKSVACMVLIFVIVFFICFLPYHALEVWFYLSPTAQTDYNDFIHALRIIAFCLSFLNSCVNPVALYCVSGVFRQHFNRYLCCRRSALHPTCSSRLSRTAICETSFRSTQRHRCNRNPTESVVISNYDYGSTKKKNNIILRNSTDGVTIMTVRDSNDFMNDVNEKRVER